jgi:hypothetical protein
MFWNEKHFKKQQLPHFQTHIESSMHIGCNREQSS